MRIILFHFTLPTMREVWDGIPVRSERKQSARSRPASTLADEILRRGLGGTFAVASEEELCRQFNVSRTTVRLALSELEGKGLIFRGRGKGTYFYGPGVQIRRTLGVLLRNPPAQDQWPLAEMMRGFHAGAAATGTNVLVTQSLPHDWMPEMIEDLGGVLLFPSGLTQTDLQFFERIRMPAILAWEVNLSGVRIDLGQVSAAKVVTERLLLGGHDRIALVSGFESGLDSLKKEGVRVAWQSVGKDPGDLPEFTVERDGESAEEVFARILWHKPHLSACVVTDDGIAARLIEYLHTRTVFRVPETFSIASFHGSPFLRRFRPKLATVEFDFYGAASRAAASLHQAALTGEAMENIVIPGKLTAGETIGRRFYSGREVRT